MEPEETEDSDSNKSINIITEAGHVTDRKHHNTTKNK